MKDNLFPVPVLFRTIQNESGTPWAEMFKVFNMGHRLEFYTGETEAQDIIKISESFGIPARVVGRVEKAAAGLSRLTVKCPAGEFNY